MNQLFRARRWTVLPERLRGMFNLNDPRWGRGDNNSVEETKPEPVKPAQHLPLGDRQRESKPAGQPPDLDELWRDINRKISHFFGGKPPKGPAGNGNGGSFQPDMKNAGVGASLIAGVVVLIWLGTGFFIVQEGQQAVITQFGKYT